VSPSESSSTSPRDSRNPSAPKLLVIRFSSFGDIVQASPVPAAFHRRYPEARIDWLVRGDFAPLLKDHPHLHQVIAFDRKEGLRGLIRRAWRLGGEGYTHLYDAHSNLRSRIFSWVFRTRNWRVNFLRRPKERIRRWLFFRLRLRHVLPVPYRGSDSYLWPLKKWGLSTSQPEGPQFWSKAGLPPDILKRLETLPRPWVVAAPSAAWEMKRWPIEHWRALVRELRGASIIFVGGPDDDFISEIAAAAPERTLNLAGRLTLNESAALVKKADLVVSGDTGILHVADLMERPTLALIGPTAFGYPSRRTSIVLEVPVSQLPCKPCSKDGRGKCRSDAYKKCLTSLLPETVAHEAARILGAGKFGV